MIIRINILIVLCSIIVITSCTSEGLKHAVIPEMKDFLRHFGSCHGIVSALQMYASKTIDTSMMGDYDLRDPVVLDTYKKHDILFYKIRVKSGIINKEYILGWEKEKIIYICILY